MLRYSLANPGGLLIFTPENVTVLIMALFNRNSALDSISATLLVSLAARMTRVYSNKHKPDISRQVASLIDYLTNSILPQLPGVQIPMLSLEIINQPEVLPFRTVTTYNPELLFNFFLFISHTISRYSSTWTEDAVQRWMICILVSLGSPESGMSFQGAADFLVL